MPSSTSLLSIVIGAWLRSQDRMGICGIVFVVAGYGAGFSYVFLFFFTGYEFFFMIIFILFDSFGKLSGSV